MSNSSLFDESFALYPSVTTVGRDQRAWAKRILFRLEKGATDLLPVQIDFAQRAMGVLPQNNSSE